MSLERSSFIAFVRCCGVIRKTHHSALDSARSPMTSRLCNVNVYVPTYYTCPPPRAPTENTSLVNYLFTRQHFHTPVDELLNDLETHLRRLISSCFKWHWLLQFCIAFSIRAQNLPLNGYKCCIIVSRHCDACEASFRFFTKNNKLKIKPFIVRWINQTRGIAGRRKGLLLFIIPFIHGPISLHFEPFSLSSLT